MKATRTKQRERTMTQQQIADELGIHQPEVSHIEARALAKLAALARAGGLSREEIMELVAGG